MEENKLVYRYKRGALCLLIYKDGSLICELRPEKEWGPEVNRDKNVDDKTLLSFVNKAYHEILERKWDKYRQCGHSVLESIYIPERLEEVNAFLTLAFIVDDTIEWGAKELPNNLEYLGDGKKPWIKNPRFLNPHYRV